MKNPLFKYLILLWLLASPFAEAKIACSLIFQQQSPEVRALVEEDAYLQWLKWEQTANFEPFRKSSKAIALEKVMVPASKVNIRGNKEALTFLKSFLRQSKSVVWLKHPWNASDKTPFISLPTTGTLPAYLTASRTVAPLGEWRGFTIKTPVDHPHGPNGEYQPGKADTSDDVRSALLHSEHIRSQDQKLGPDDQLIILPEVATIAQRRSEIGYIIRDARQTDDGHYYLPAFSIPYIGREIARLNKKDFSEFWRENYARILGEAKARLLLRYGLQMETPNSQNILIQFDRTLHPTGRLVFRDMSDAFLVRAVAEAFGFQTAIARDQTAGYHPVVTLKPFASNSMWLSNEAGDLSVDSATIDFWTRAHNRAYVQYILQALNLSPYIDVSMGMAGIKKVNLIDETEKDDEMKLLYRYLDSAEGQQALRKYRSSLD